MSRRHWWLYAAVFALIESHVGIAAAQVALPSNEQKTPDNVLLPTLFPYVRFDRVTGMTKGAVAAIAQDRDGFIWFGTDEGLSRYDGYEFVNYMAGSDDKNTLSNFTVTSLASVKDSLWIGTAKGLNRLDLTTNKFTHYRNNPQDASTVASDYIVSLHSGTSGLIWIGTADAGVDSLDPATGAIKHYRAQANQPFSLSDDDISVVFEDHAKQVWVGTREAGLCRLDPATGKVVRFKHLADRASSLSNDQVTAIFEDSAGALWVGTVDGLNKLDAATGEFKHYLDDPDAPKWITSIVEGADGGLWLGVKGIGVFRFARNTGALEKYTHDGGDSTTISHPWTRAAFSDRGGVLWFGFNAGGASKLYLLRRKLSFYRTDPGLSFLEDQDQVWIGSQGRGIRQLNLKNGTIKTYLDDDLSATWTMAIAAGDKGSLWLGTTDRGLFHFWPRSNELETYDTDNGKLASDSVFALLREGNTLWIATFGAGLAHLDPSGNTVAYFKNDPGNAATLSSDYVTTLHQDRSDANILWVGTSGGLNAFDKRTGKVTRYLHDPLKPTSVSHDHITDIYEDKNGQLWVTTWGGGLNKLDRTTGVFKAYHMHDGLASEVLYGILEDKEGALWLTTNDGLTKLDPKTGRTTTFHASDGLQDDEFGQGAFYQGASGRFYVGGPHGFNVFVPEDIKADTYMPPLALTKFEIVGEAKPLPTSVSLSYRDRWFSIGFSALAYAAPVRNRYRYRLIGFHDWIETDRRFVSYASLPPGNYTLEIVGSNEHGVWNDKGLQLPIHVSPPPWRTWWAYTAYGLLGLLSAGLFIRRQRGQLDALRRMHRLSELEREMQLTSAVQEGFFPVARSVNDGVFQLESFYRAAAQCGGDWWSYEARKDSYFVVVGDATGHGAGSAMVTAAAAACFRSLGPGVDDDTRLRAMNEEVLRVSRGQYHMTLTAVEINLITGRYVILSAGGVPVFTLPPTGRPRVLMCPGTPLGSAEFEIGKLEGKLAPGERLLILTDGIPEVALANTQLLGPRGVANFYMQTRTDELPTALQQLIKKVEDVQAGVQDDDWTVVMTQWGHPVMVSNTTVTAVAQP